MPDQLLLELQLIYYAELGLGVDLARWFGQTTWLPLRLVLADLRRKTNRHIVAIGALLPLAEGLRPDAALPDDEVTPVSCEPGPAAAVAGAALRAARAAALVYRAALDLATERRFSAAATTLSQALAEEIETEHRLSTMVAEIAGQ